MFNPSVPLKTIKVNADNCFPMKTQQLDGGMK